MEELKARHAEQIAALNRWHAEDTKYLKRRVVDLYNDNHELDLQLSRHQETIAEKDRQIFILTSSGQAYSTEPCALCGRIGESYVQDTGEAIQTAPKSIKEENACPSSGKPWDHKAECYILPVRKAPDFHHNRCARIEARIRKRDGKSEPGDEELLKWRSQEEEELVENGQGAASNEDNEVDEKGWKTAGPLADKGETGDQGW